MTDPLFSVERNTAFALAVPGSVDQEMPPETVETILDRATYARMSQIATTEVKPLYSRGATDFAVPTTTPIDSWKIENSLYDFNLRLGNPEVDSNSAALVAQVSGGVLEADPAFSSVPTSATYFIVADPGIAVGASNSPIMQVGGIWTLSETTNNRLLVIYRDPADDQQLFFTRDLAGIITNRFNATLVVEPSRFLLYVNGVVELDESTPTRKTTKSLEASIYPYASNAAFWAKWTDEDQPTVADLQNILLPAIP